MSYTSSRKTKMLVEGGLVIAMAQILSMYVIYQMPQGGAVKAANSLANFSSMIVCILAGTIGKRNVRFPSFTVVSHSLRLDTIHLFGINCTSS